MKGKGKKIAAAVVLVVLILAVAAPIPIPVRKTMTGMAKSLTAPALPSANDPYTMIALGW